MVFEIFEKNTARSTEPIVTISPNGRIAFNVITVEKFLKGSVGVCLMRDVSGEAVAIKPMKKADKNTFSIQQTKSGGATVTSRAFVETLNLKERTKISPIYDEKDHALVLKLTKK